ncbi:hypothetical protein N7474_004291 [Penicillium riverlandense]|uniref:uncharacterized protein n=1 Tax=Penicillium riverlandense TaxID=1903569 RepID=UPI002549529B|nr:uncharacterized protein N7474_004291 [Penicillium riverlandense]KAJ5818700.1 hypothetical protein N7474_004291 [Penicillium riverlandense]
MSHDNYAVFRECLSSAIVARSEEKKPSKTPRRRHKTKHVPTQPTSTSERADPEELAEFIDFLASETFAALPESLQNLSYAAVQHDPNLANTYNTDTSLNRNTLDTLTSPIPVEITDSLTVYGIISSPDNLPDFLSPVLSEYISSVTAAPPVWIQTRAEACEICERDWIPLSYHHLIPRGVHAKVRKKGWHDEWMLNSVAWLCRACHSFVHRMASNEELAREWFTIERILEREDVRDWARWVGRVRWKAR